MDFSVLKEVLFCEGIFAGNVVKRKYKTEKRTQMETTTDDYNLPATALINQVRRLGVTASLLVSAVCYYRQMDDNGFSYHLLWFTIIVNALIALFSREADTFAKFFPTVIIAIISNTLTSVFSLIAHFETKSLWWCWLITICAAGVALYNQVLSLSSAIDQRRYDVELAMETRQAFLTWNLPVDRTYKIVQAWGRFPSDVLLKRMSEMPTNTSEARKNEVIQEVLAPYEEYANYVKT